MKKSVLFVFRKKSLLWIVLFFLVAEVFAESYWDVFSQAHLNLVGLPLSAFGITFGMFAAVNAAASYYVDVIERALGEKWSMYTIVLIQSGLFGLMAFCRSWVGLVLLLFLFTTMREFTWLINEYYRNRYVPSERRASILSAISFLNNGLFGGGVIIWLFGVSLDGLGGGRTLIISGLIVLVVGLLLLQVRYKGCREVCTSL